MSTPHKKLTKAQKKKERERQQRADMAAELHLIQQISKTSINHQPNGGGGGVPATGSSIATTLTTSASAPGNISSIAGSGNNNGTTRPSRSGGGGSSDGSGGASAPETRENVPMPPLPEPTRKPPLATNLWPLAPKLPIGQALSYGWKIPFPASPDSLRPTSLGSGVNSNGVGEVSVHLLINSGILDRYREARRQRYAKAALQSGLAWECK